MGGGVNAPATREAVAELQSAFKEILQDSNLCFTISSARSPDLPLVYVSPGFTAMTGYAAVDCIGHNCRFLQGPGTSHQAVLEIRDAIREERPHSVCLLNYRKGGSPFWNAFHLAPVRGSSDGPVEFFIGVQADATRMVEAAAAQQGGGSAGVATAAAASALAADRAQGEALAGRLASHAATLAARQAAAAGIAACAACAADRSVPSSLLAALSRVQGCFVLSDPNKSDCPIVYASNSFLKMTGYSCGQTLGRNCRFLQGPGTDPAQVEALRQALDSQRSATVTLLNYRHDRTPFWNCLHISPVRDADGKVQFFAGVQLDVTAQQAEQGQQQQQHVVSAEGGAAPAMAAACGTAAPAAEGAGMPTAAVPVGSTGEAALPEPLLAEPNPVLLLTQKGVVASLRVATRALATHGLRRAPQFQRRPSQKDGGGSA